MSTAGPLPTPPSTTPRLVPFKPVSEAEYLRRDAAAEGKLEYLDGQVFAMAGASVAHNFITDNTLGALLLLLRGKTCRPIGSDMRLFIEKNRQYFYPDLTVVCGERQLKTDTQPASLLNPMLIIEVLSPSTGDYDRGRKFEAYQTIPTLRHYVLLDSARVSAYLYSRDPGADLWTLRYYEDLTAVLPLNALGIELPLAEAYSAVVFGEGEREGGGS